MKRRLTRLLEVVVVIKNKVELSQVEHTENINVV